MKKFEMSKITVITFSQSDVITTSSAEENKYNLSPSSNGYNDNNTVIGNGTFSL